MGHALLGELTGFLEGALAGCGIRDHAQLADQDHRADLRIRLLDFARELERLLRGCEPGFGVALGEHLGLGRANGRERAIALGLLRQHRRALQRLRCALAVAVLREQHRRVVEGARDLIEQAKLLIELEALLVVDDGRLEIAVVLVVLRHAGVQAGEGGAIAELLRESDGALVCRHRLPRLPHIGLRHREVDQTAEEEGRVLHHAVLTGGDAFAQEPVRVLIRVGARVRGGEHRLQPNSLLLVLEEIGHALGALDHREGLLWLARAVVGDGEIPKTHQLIGRAQAILELLQDLDRLERPALLNETSRFNELVLRRRGARRSAEQVRRLHAQPGGDVLERLHRRPRASGLEHRDVCLRVERISELRLGQPFRGPQRADARADIGDHGGADLARHRGRFTLRACKREVNFV